MKGVIKEFRSIMIRRGIVDLAAGVVLAGAFRTVMTSLINDVILPPVSTFVSGVNISNLSYIIKKSAGGMPPVAIGYGRFIQTAIDFAILGIAVSMVLHGAEKLTDKAAADEPKDPAPGGQGGDIAGGEYDGVRGGTSVKIQRKLGRYG